MNGIPPGLHLVGDTALWMGNNFTRLKIKADESRLVILFKFMTKRSTLMGSGI